MKYAEKTHAHTHTDAELAVRGSRNGSVVVTFSGHTVSDCTSSTEEITEEEEDRTALESSLRNYQRRRSRTEDFSGSGVKQPV